MRNTGNRGLEAIHGIFRGGSSTLPITAPNLTFQEFLSKMNKTNQIHRVERKLKLIEGHSIVASKHKRKTSALHSSEAVSPTLAGYRKPKMYSEFVKELTDACTLGNEDSKQAISDLAPQVADALKSNEQWENPNVAIEAPPASISTISSEFDSTKAFTPHIHQELIDNTLGPITITQSCTSKSDESNNSIDISEACANLIYGHGPYHRRRFLYLAKEHSQTLKRRPALS